VRYTDTTRDRVRDAVDMVDLVSSRTELRRSGPRSFMGICPFHEERSPSLSVEPVEKLYHCFGCGASGDAFGFVMEAEGVDFKGALELLTAPHHSRARGPPARPRRARNRERLACPASPPGAAAPRRVSSARAMAAR